MMDIFVPVPVSVPVVALHCNSLYCSAFFVQVNIYNTVNLLLLYLQTKQQKSRTLALIHSSSVTSFNTAESLSLSS